MNNCKSSFGITLAGCWAIAIAAVGIAFRGVAFAEETLPVAGTNTWSIVATHDAVTVDGPKDAPVFVSSLKGRTKERTLTGLFDGAMLYDTGVGEVDGTRIRISSVSRGEKGGDVYFFSNEAVCDVLNPGSESEYVQCNGTWRLVPGGTGRYASLRGSGTWRSAPGPNGEEIAQFEGVVVR